MNLYLQMVTAAWVAVFIVDLSGFTDFWRGLLARWLKRPQETLRTVKPFGCSLCVTWWACLALALAAGRILEPLPWAAAAGCAWLTAVFRAAAIRLQEVLLHIFNWKPNKKTTTT
ncbi:MAG: hypothetical protein IKR32_02655 [Bacteroidales bacterium]|nr:hypothetical protein [Clostridia bacterium]MBR6280182.1 hypothetical protein [Bacteroidales bacterium]